MTEQCNRCRFWLAVPDEVGDCPEDGPGFGWCRRNPPTLSDHMASMIIDRPRFGGHNYDPESVATVGNVHNSSLFPATWQTTWCGQFEPVTATLLGVLAERNELIEYISAAKLADVEANEQCGRLDAIDNRIMETPAASRDDVFAKLLLMAELRTEGTDVVETRAAAIVSEALIFAGVGRVSSNIAAKAES
jgi:hypothetical protein